MNNQLPRPSPPPLPPVILSQTMDYGTCYHSNSNADRPVRLSTNCALEMVVIPTQKGFRVHDSIEVQFAFPHDTAVNGGQAFAHAPTHRTNAIHSPSNCKLIYSDLKYFLLYCDWLVSRTLETISLISSWQYLIPF